MPYHIDLRNYGLDGRPGMGGSIPGFPIWLNDGPDAFVLTTAERRQALAGVSWFLEFAKDGLPLTASGYLKPVDVGALAAVLPEAGRWHGKKNREDLTPAVAEFRQAMHELGLIRKFKGRLILTPAGRQCRGHPEMVWEHVTHRVIPPQGTIRHDVTMLCLIHTVAGQYRDLELVANQLTTMGWTVGRGLPVEPSDLWGCIGGVDAIIDNMYLANHPGWWRDSTVPKTARAFSYRALSVSRTLVMNRLPKA